MFIKSRLLLSLIPLLLSGACSSLLDGSTQEVRVETPGAAGGYCYLERSGLKYKTFPPQTIKITNNNEDLTVNCTMPGNRRKTITVAVLAGESVFYNVMNGIIPGLAYDYKSGAMFKYPDVITVDFTDVPSKVRPLPDYQRLLLDNPLLAEVEEFRSGASALQRDRDWPIQTLKKRVFPLFDTAEEGEIVSSIEEIPASDDSWATAKPSNMVITAGDGSSDSSSDNGGAAALTRQMNPQVFDAPASSGSEPSGSDASGIPEPLYPSY